MMQSTPRLIILPAIRPSGLKFLLIKKQNEELEIADFYFGTPDGIDTIATGHYTEREVNNPQIWEDEEWVLGATKNTTNSKTYRIVKKYCHIYEYSRFRQIWQYLHRASTI